MMKMRYHRLFCMMAALSLCFMSVAASAQPFVQAGSAQYSLADSGFLPGMQAVVPMVGNQFLSVHLVRKASDSKEIVNAEQLLLAVDEAGRIYTPLLFNGESAFTASLAENEKAFRVLFEVPKAAGSYHLAVLSGLGGVIEGKVELGKSAGPVLPADGVPLAEVKADGYDVTIHSVAQSKTAFLDEAPGGMKYVIIDATFTGTGTFDSIAQLAEQWAISYEGKTETGIIPTRAYNMLALMNVRFSEHLQATRGKICFLVPEGLTELTGLRFGQTAMDQPLLIGRELTRSGLTAPEEDGAYQQAGWKVTIHGMRLTDKGTLADPPAGSKYVIVNLTVDNKSTQNLTVSSELGFAMTDHQGNELTQAWFADLAETLDASLLPSESVTGEVAFLLPDGAKAGMLRVHLNMLGEPLIIDTALYLAE